MGHFVFIFVKCVRYISRFFFFLHMDVQLFQHHLLKRLSLLHCTAFVPFQRSGDYIYVGLFLSSLFHSNDLFICSFNTPTLS